MGGTSAGVIIGACITQRPELFCAAVVVDGLFDLMRHHLLSPPTDGPTLPTRCPDSPSSSPSPSQSSAPTTTAAAVQQQGQNGQEGEWEKADKDKDEDEDGGMELVPLWTQEFGSVDGASFKDAVRLLHLSPLHNILAPAPVPPKPRGAARRRQQGAAGKPPSPPPVVAKKFPAVLLLVSGASSTPVPRAHSFKFIAELQRVCGSGSTNPLLIHIDRDDDDDDDSYLEEVEGEGGGEGERRRRGSSVDSGRAAPAAVARTDETRRVALALTFLAKFMGAAYRPSDDREEEDSDEEEDDAEVGIERHGPEPGPGPGPGPDRQGRSPPGTEEKQESEGEDEEEGEEEGEGEGEGEGESLHSHDSLADLGEDFYDGREEEE